MNVDVATRSSGSSVLQTAPLEPGRQIAEDVRGALLAQYLERRGLRVHRTDATPAFVERLRQSGCQARLLDVRCDGLGGPFDAVLAHAVLLHLERDDLRRALRACFEATRTGGVFALPLKEGDGEAWSDAKLGQPRWFVSWREPALRQALDSAGWTVVRLEHVDGRLEAWLHVLCRREDSSASSAPSRRSIPGGT